MVRTNMVSQGSNADFLETYRRSAAALANSEMGVIWFTQQLQHMSDQFLVGSPYKHLTPAFLDPNRDDEDTRLYIRHRIQRQLLRFMFRHKLNTRDSIRFYNHFNHFLSDFARNLQVRRRTPHSSAITRPRPPPSQSRPGVSARARGRQLRRSPSHSPSRNHAPSPSRGLRILTPTRRSRSRRRSSTPPSGRSRGETVTSVPSKSRRLGNDKASGHALDHKSRPKDADNLKSRRSSRILKQSSPIFHIRRTLTRPPGEPRPSTSAGPPRSLTPPNLESLPSTSAASSCLAAPSPYQALLSFARRRRTSTSMLRDLSLDLQDQVIPEESGDVSDVELDLIDLSPLNGVPPGDSP